MSRPEEKTTAEALVAGTKPARLELDPGTYWWCACGRSKNQPFCDGSHKGTGIAPVRIDVAEKKMLALCLCKRTANPPMCDGTHRTVQA